MSDHAAVIDDVSGERFRPGPWAVGLVALCLAPLILWVLGFDFSTRTVPLTVEGVGQLSKLQLAEAAHLALRGSYTHTLLEWTALALASFVCLLAFVQFRLNKDASLPIIGVALICAGTMDGFHTFAADRLITAVADNRDLIPFTWAICRLFNATIMLVGLGILAFTHRQRLRERGGLIIVSISTVFIVSAYAIVSYCANTTNLPQTMFADAAIKRPYDIYPIVPFALCAVLLMGPWFRRCRNAFTDTILLSMIPAIATQCYMAFGSFKLHDAAFNIAHSLKAVSYLVPILGLLWEYVHTHRAQEPPSELPIPVG